MYQNNSPRKKYRNELFLKRLVCLIVFLVWDTMEVGVAPTFLSDSHFGSGSVTITSTTKSNTFNQNFTVTFSPALPAPTSYYNIVIGITQFVIPSVNRIEFNFSKYSMTTTSFILNCKFGNQTVFSQLGINYMVIDNSITDNQLIMYDYTCSVLNQSTGFRSQKISHTTTKLSNFNVTALRANIVLQSFNVSNFNGYFFTLYNSIVQTNHTFTIQLITTNFNQFQSIQFWLMVCDYSPMSMLKTYYQDIQNYPFNSALGISNYISSINNSLYLGANRYFFGVSQFNFSNYMTSTLKLDTTNPANLAQNYLFTNISFVYMFAYFRAKRTCPASNYYSIATSLCDTTCAAPQNFIDSTNMICLSCYYTCAANSCNSSLQNQCFTCYDASRAQKFTSTLANGTSMYSCPCATGYFQSGLPTCYTCGNYIPGCTNCSDSLTCTSCNAANNLVLNGTSCKCSDHTKVQIGSLCYGLIGCTAITMSGSTALCTQCSWAKGFVFISTYVCGCQNHKSVVQVTSGDYYCLYTCGDGYVSPNQGCDDANLINGDGCSNKCTVQTNFTCTGVLNITSVCLYNIKINLSYIGAMRQIYLNRAEFYFSMSPRDLKLTQIPNLSSFIVTTIPHTKLQANLLDINSQDALNQVYYLQVILDYSESIQNQPYDLYINLTNYWQWMYDSTTSNFVVSGANAQISYKSDSNLSMYLTIEYIVLALVGITYIMAFVSLFFDRLIGIQLMVTVQTIYYLLFAVQQNPVQLVLLEKSLVFSTGFNKIIYFLTSDYPQYLRTYFLPSNFQHQAYEKQFIMNFNISFAIFLFTLLIIFIFYLANKCKKIQYQTNQDLFRIQLGNQNGQSCCSLQKIYECLFNRILVFVSFWIMPQIIFAICIQTNQYQPDFYIFQDSINVLSSFLSFLLLVCLILGLAYWYMKQSVQEALQAKKSIIDQNKNLLPLSFQICKLEYPIIYIIYQFVKFMLIALFLEYAVSLDILLCLQVGYFIFIVIYRPYLRLNPNLQDDQSEEDKKLECFSIHNFTIAFNQLILICFCFLILIWNQTLDNYNFSSQYPSIIVYATIIFLLFLNIFALLRFFYKKLGKLFCCEGLFQKIFKTEGEGEDQFEFQHMRKLFTKNDLDKLKKQQEQQVNEKDDQDQLSKADKKSILKDLKKNKTNFMNWPEFQNESENQEQNYSKFPNKNNANNTTLSNQKNFLGKSKIVQDYTERDITLLVSNQDSIDQSIDLLNKSNKKIFKGLNWVKQSQIQPSLNSNSKSSSKAKEIPSSSNQSVLQNFLQNKTVSQPAPYVTDFVIRKSSNKKQAQLKKTGLQVLIQQKMAQANQSLLNPIKQQDEVNLQQVKERLKKELQQKTNKKKQPKSNKQRKQSSKESKQLKQIRKLSVADNGQDNQYKYIISSSQGEQKVNLLDKSKQKQKQKGAKNKYKKDQAQQQEQQDHDNKYNNSKKLDPMKLFSFGMGNNDDGI